MKIIWLADLHLVEPGKAFPAGVDPLPRTRLCLEDALAHYDDAHRLVITGDLVQLRNPGFHSGCESVGTLVGHEQIQPPFVELLVVFRLVRVN